MSPPRWHRFEELRPDQLAGIVRDTPIAYWSLGLLEHHGWHLPVGFDGIKADRLCQRLAEQTGGVILPVMWWGGGGGHADFLWTFYQDEAAARRIVVDTTTKLIRFGFRVVVLMMGHYPWEQIVGEQLTSIQNEHPDVSIIWGTEATICHPAFDLPGDHAARAETSYGLALLPELIDTNALTPGRDSFSYPNGVAVPLGMQYPGVHYDPADALFAQMGEDARKATQEEGETALTHLVQHLVTRITSHMM